MSDNDIVNIFRTHGALLEGHFGLTSGKHSGTYLQCAQVLQYPRIARDLGSLLASSVLDSISQAGEGDIDLVLSPAVGGIVIGQETASSLNVRAIFCERVDGAMTFRRGFFVQPGDRVVVVEDVVTTGGSLKEAAELAKIAGAEVVATASIVHRYIDEPQDPTDSPHVSLLKIHALAYEPSDCPMCLEGISLEKPGSRHLSPPRGL